MRIEIIIITLKNDYSCGLQILKKLKKVNSRVDMEKNVVLEYESELIPNHPSCFIFRLIQIISRFSSQRCPAIKIKSDTNPTRILISW